MTSFPGDSITAIIHFSHYPFQHFVSSQSVLCSNGGIHRTHRSFVSTLPQAFRRLEGGGTLRGGDLSVVAWSAATLGAVTQALPSPRITPKYTPKVGEIRMTPPPCPPPLQLVGPVQDRPARAKGPIVPGEGTGRSVVHCDGNETVWTDDRGFKTRHCVNLLCSMLS